MHIWIMWRLARYGVGRTVELVSTDESVVAKLATTGGGDLMAQRLEVPDILFAFTRAQAQALAGRALTDSEVERIAAVASNFEAAVERVLDAGAAGTVGAPAGGGSVGSVSGAVIIGRGGSGPDASIGVCPHCGAYGGGGHGGGCPGGMAGGCSS